MTTPAPLDGPPTPAEIAAAQRLGVSVDLYRQFKRHAGAGADKFEQGEGPADIFAEQQLAEKMRREPGLFKSRNEAPGIFVEAARTPGEVAQTLLTIFCYLVLMFLIVIFGGEKVQRVPGILQVTGLFILVIPAMKLSSLVWEGVGERVRDFFRLLIRVWPVTLLGLIFFLGMIKLLLRK